MTTSAISATQQPTAAVLLGEFSWKRLVLQGVLGILFGAAVLVFPFAALASFALLWGVWAMLDGAASLSEVSRKVHGTGTRVLYGVMGVVALAAGVFAVLRPFLTVGALTWVLGLWLLARGVAELVAAVPKQSAKSRILLALAAVLDIALGLLFFLNPGGSAMSLTVVFGLLALAWGIVAVITGVAVKVQKGAHAPRVEETPEVSDAQSTLVDPSPNA